MVGSLDASLIPSLPGVTELLQVASLQRRKQLFHLPHSQEFWGPLPSAEIVPEVEANPEGSDGSPPNALEAHAYSPF